MFPLVFPLAFARPFFRSCAPAAAFAVALVCAVAGTAGAAGSAGAAAPLPPPVVSESWTYNPSSAEGKSYFHPLVIPGDPKREAFTSFRPADHKWHLGLWFSWKFINKVNFWEPDKRAKIRTLTSSQSGAKAAGAGATDTFVSEIVYEASGAEVVRERRRVVVSTAPNGNYTIRWDAAFTAVAEKVVLDRTKPGKSRRTGNWESGGYAGLNLRFADEPAFRYTFASDNGLQNAAICGNSAGAVIVEIAGKNGARATLTFRDLSDQATGEAADKNGTVGGAAGGAKFPAGFAWPPKWFVRHQPGAQRGRGYYVLGSAPVFDAPLTLARGETLRLRYEIAVERLPNKPPLM
ncbi:MAG: PmoA family protein [Puniceicoccales bacterium]|jgi:hypothetical protein|nr:PmoA family protein [Puniceicoccales bacterium]